MVSLALRRLKVLVILAAVQQWLGVERDVGQIGVGKRPLVGHHLVNNAVILVAEDQRQEIVLGMIGLVAARQRRLTYIDLQNKRWDVREHGEGGGGHARGFRRHAPLCARAHA